MFPGSWKTSGRVGPWGMPGECRAAGLSSQPGHVLLLLSSTARELLQREEKEEGQRQQGDARLALNETPPGRGRCCAR